ncbi:MAG: methyltransferase domain-containing protein [Chlamydiae bacterium]|nr:methyltransferase domain-containing protein [Chlamydiota bacterium]MBI3276190.1 methyltransferase domain-containing protein [Chlamydiota bacterium]
MANLIKEVTKGSQSFSLDSWYLDYLVCPRDYGRLRSSDHMLICPVGHRYPVVEGVPVMLLDDVKQTMQLVNGSLRRARGEVAINDKVPNLYLESLGMSEEEKQGVVQLALSGDCKIDPVVAYIIGATNGYLYKHLIGRLDSYPIPDLYIHRGSDKTLLDLGCNWGRWSISAARKGYDVVGIDVSLGAIMAAQRVSRALNLSGKIKYVVADARYLPFPSSLFDHVFSYSVLQHFSKEDVSFLLPGVARVLKKKGESLIQMPNFLGIRCLYHQAKRRFRKARNFEVRYWSIPSLGKMFREIIGKTEIFVDCFLGLGVQKADLPMMLKKQKIVIISSELLKRISRFIPFLKILADSVYVRSIKT